ncbi:MAG: FmdB family transcriptional regulator [Microbacteriaceae bacterium]|jgi:putative FmdB family regulatory protein|nr:FmdB family transcriptional regulator [Microbacteriaceae bacterium]
MPTYSYRCTACDVAFDIQQEFTDDSLTTCEACGGALRKLFSAVGVTFQGSGFYRTDSRAEATKASSSSTTSTEKKSGDSKPAAAQSTSSGTSTGTPAASTT